MFREVVRATLPPMSIDLHSTMTGSGDPVVLVHGSWSDHTIWDLVAPDLARSFTVIACDRRGYGASPSGRPATLRDQEDDLARLIERLDRGPVHLAGTSFGGSIALGVAARRPDLVRAVVAHEPPLAGLVEASPEIQAAVETVDQVIARIDTGDAEGAAAQFVEEVALGPGAWDMLPPPVRAMMIGSAAAFRDEQRDPAWNHIAPDALGDITCPVTLTQGDMSPSWFRPIVTRLAGLVPHAVVHEYPGAGHAPHATHPADWCAHVSHVLGLQGATR